MKTLSLLTTFAGFLAIISCSKCKDCHYDDVDHNEVEIGELCDEELKNAEENGYAINDSTTVTTHCEEH